jgi:transposase-like protein
MPKDPSKSMKHWGIRRKKCMELFNKGVSITHIAKLLGVQRQVIYRWTENYRNGSTIPDTLSKALALTDHDEVLNLSGIFRDPRELAARIKELKAACKKGNVAAIVTWLKLASVKLDAKPDPISTIIRMPVVRNDSYQKKQLLEATVLQIQEEKSADQKG